MITFYWPYSLLIYYICELKYKTKHNEKQGKDIMIGFNPKFLIDALRVIDDENVTLYMMNPKAPCFIRNDEQSYIYLILPVNFTTVN